MNIRLGLSAIFTAVALAAAPSAALAAVDAFIWFESVAGTSRDPGHAGWFEIKDFSFGVENPTTIGSATGGAGAGKVKLNEFTIKRTPEGAGSGFRRAMTPGRHFPTVKLQMRKAGGGLTTYVFTDVRVSKIDWSGPGDEGPKEIVTFVYGRMVEQPPATPRTGNFMAPKTAQRPRPAAPPPPPPTPESSREAPN